MDQKKELHTSSTDWKIVTVTGVVKTLWYKGKDTKVIIPTTINDKNVVSVGRNSPTNVFCGNNFSLTTNVINIDLSKAIYLTSIGEYAFSGTKITAVTLSPKCTYEANSFDATVKITGGTTAVRTK